MVQREGWVVNHTRVGRRMQELGLSARRPGRKQRTTNSAHGYPRWPNLVEGLELVQPDQVWVGAITYVTVRQGFVYLAVLMDGFTRSSRGWHLSRSLNSDLTQLALRHAVQRHTPAMHHADQGVQYACGDDGRMLQAHGVEMRMATSGDPTENGYAERLIRTIKEEHIDLTEYHDVADAWAQLGRFLNQVYQHKRIHSALGSVTPAEFEHQWDNEQSEDTMFQAETP